MKKTPIEASKRLTEKTVYFNLQDKIEKLKPIIILDLFTTADIKRTSQKELVQVGATYYIH